MNAFLPKNDDVVVDVNIAPVLLYCFSMLQKEEQKKWPSFLVSKAAGTKREIPTAWEEK